MTLLLGLAVLAAESAMERSLVYQMMALFGSKIVLKWLEAAKLQEADDAFGGRLGEVQRRTGRCVRQSRMGWK